MCCGSLGYRRDIKLIWIEGQIDESGSKLALKNRK